MSSLSNYRLVALTLGARLGVLLLATVSASYLKPFDSSGGNDAWIRWDAIHFAHVAQDGYTFEHDWAFLSGLHFLLRHIPRPIFYIICTLMDIATTLTLHDLTAEVLGVTKLADLATLLSLLPSSPATFRLAPYNEPFFAFLAYRGACILERPNDCSQRTRNVVLPTKTVPSRSYFVHLGWFLPIQQHTSRWIHPVEHACRSFLFRDTPAALRSILHRAHIPPIHRPQRRRLSPFLQP